MSLSYGGFDMQPFAYDSSLYYFQGFIIIIIYRAVDIHLLIKQGIIVEGTFFIGIEISV
jgi:hypothetical protein